MRAFIIVAIVGLSMLGPEVAWGQSPPPPAELGARSLLKSEPPNAQGRPPIVATDRTPAVLCERVLAFAHEHSSELISAAQPSPQIATAVQAPAQGVLAPPPAGNDRPQQTSGITAPVTNYGLGTSGPQGATKEVSGSPASRQSAESQPPQSYWLIAQPLGQNAPGGTSATAAPTKKPSVTQLESIEAAARNQDHRRCRQAAQGMRRAGIAMPHPLLALIALDLKFFESGPKR